MIKPLVIGINKKLEGDKVLWLCVVLLTFFSILTEESRLKKLISVDK